jgi:hypothetical protein
MKKSYNQLDKMVKIVTVNNELKICCEEDIFIDGRYQNEVFYLVGSCEKMEITQNNINGFKYNLISILTRASESNLLWIGREDHPELVVKLQKVDRFDLLVGI